MANENERKTKHKPARSQEQFFFGNFMRLLKDIPIKRGLCIFVYAELRAAGFVFVFCFRQNGRGGISRRNAREGILVF